MNLNSEELNQHEVQIEQSETINYSCKNCGDELLFDPSNNCLKCKSCGNKVIFDKKETEVVENCFFEALQNENSIKIDENSKVNEIQCNNCGATMVYQDNIISNKCIYCNSANVIICNDDNYLRPEYLVPFKIPKQLSNQLIEKWCNRKFYMNKNFKKTIVHNDFYGVYIPYWTYDTDTVTHYTAIRGTYYYSTTTRNGKTTRTRHTRWRPVSGVYNKFFDDILVPATKNTESIDYKKVVHFYLDDLVRYDEKYIAGFLSKKYDFNLKNGWADAKIFAKNELEYLIKKEIGGDTVKNLKMFTNHSNITYKHVLLPLWIYTYNYKDKIYNFLMNGQTGTVFAKYPLNWFRVILTGIIIFILAQLFIT